MSSNIAIAIFRAQSNKCISQLYQFLGCQHHFVQTDSHSRPITPALTPVGFAHWLAIFILAYPDVEYKRLKKIVASMPIDADEVPIDGKPERLPKAISRHLLPKEADLIAKKMIDNAVLQYFDNLGSSTRIYEDQLGSFSSGERRNREPSPPHKVTLHHPPNIFSCVIQLYHFMPFKVDSHILLLHTDLELEHRHLRPGVPHPHLFAQKIIQSLDLTANELPQNPPYIIFRSLHLLHEEACSQSL